MREIILDTETTGFNSRGDDRIVEIACLEIINKKATNNVFHTYINPMRDIPLSATRVHNITSAMVKDKPTFDLIAQDFLDFIQDDPLIIHNAPFDMGFLNAELERCNLKPLSSMQALDTLLMARKKFPGSNNTLDGLCKRYKIDLSNRQFHGALVDCDLLVQVYIELLGGKQKTLFFDDVEQTHLTLKQTSSLFNFSKEKRYFPPSPDEIEEHKEFVNTLPNSLWKKLSA
jgi:DNA polymerase-3 subunit epsilon